MADLPPDAQAAWASLPNVMSYSPEEPLLPGYHLEDRVRRGWIIAGGTIFGASYGATVTIGLSASERNGALWIPVVGPLVTIGNLDFSGGNAHLAEVGVCAVGAAAQAVGLGVAIAGIATTRKVQVKDEPGRATRAPALRFDARGPILVF